MRRCGWWVLSWAVMLPDVVSREGREARMTAGDGVAVRDSPPPSPLGLARGSRAKSPYFGGALRGKKSGIHVAWMLACARMTAGGVSWVVGSFTVHDTPPSSCPTPIGHPFPPLTSYPRMRVSRAMSPYFGGVLRGKESGISAAWILAFARMTAGGVSWVVGSFTGGDVSL